MNNHDRLWVEVTCNDDAERVFITADDGPFERRTEPFEPYVPWPGDGEWHVSFTPRHSSPPNPIPVVMMLVAVAMMLIVVFK